MGGFLKASQAHEAAQISNLTLYESHYKLEWMEDPWTDVEEAGAWLLELAQRVQPDLVHLNNYVHGALPWSVPVLMVGHSCVLSWWQAQRRAGTCPLANLSPAGQSGFSKGGLGCCPHTHHAGGAP